MHRLFTKRVVSTAFQTVVVLLVITSLVSCATWEGHKRGKTRGDITRKYPANKDVKRPDEKQFASISSPARSASMDMVGKGKLQLENGNLEKALGIFQEAVIIDSTNGIAYYYLAKSRYNLDQFEEALGILDKAESLLETDEDWTEAVTLLRQQIRESYIN